MDDSRSQQDTNAPDLEFDAQLEERFAQLPQIIQDAITSADTEKNLRSLADTHALHVDQWQQLEKEVMLALLGFQPPESLAHNIETEVGTTKEVATALTADISRLIFEPIREELERQLGHPHAKTEEQSDIEKIRESVLAEETPKIVPATVAPSTPPNPAPSVVVDRPNGEGAYAPSVPSTTRKDVTSDPYREQP